MATQRYISTSFWDDEWVSTLDPSEKLLFLYFMTCPLTNISGIYEITLRRISFDTGFNYETINKIIERFQNEEKLYFVHNYVIIPSWPSHQKWKMKPTIRTGIEKCLSEVPKKVWSDIVRYRIPYRYPIDKILISYGYSPSYLDLNLNSDTDLDTDTDIDKDLDSDSDLKKEKKIKKESYPQSDNSQPFQPYIDPEEKAEPGDFKGLMDQIEQNAKTKKMG